jgi:hypothetical protein
MQEEGCLKDLLEILVRKHRAKLLRFSYFDFVFSVVILLSSSAAAQESTNSQKFWCAMDKASQSVDGEAQYLEVTPDDRKPQIITIPFEDKEALVFEEFSEDGRFYRYIKKFDSDQWQMAIHGVFDLSEFRFSTSNSLFLQFEGVTRPVARSFVWACSEYS